MFMKDVQAVRDTNSLGRGKLESGRPGRRQGHTSQLRDSEEDLTRDCGNRVKGWVGHGRHCTGLHG